MLQVKKIVGKLLSSNINILFEDGISDCWLIDIGDLSAIEKEFANGWNVKGVFLTHSHFDHMDLTANQTANSPSARKSMTRRCMIKWLRSVWLEIRNLIRIAASSRRIEDNLI